MKKPHEYLSDAASVASIFDQAYDAEAHWSRIAEAAVVLCQQDAQRQIDALREQLLVNAEALLDSKTRNGPPVLRHPKQAQLLAELIARTDGETPPF